MQAGQTDSVVSSHDSSDDYLIFDNQPQYEAVVEDPIKKELAQKIEEIKSKIKTLETRQNDLAKDRADLKKNKRLLAKFPFSKQHKEYKKVKHDLKDVVGNKWHLILEESKEELQLITIEEKDVNHRLHALKTLQTDLKKSLYSLFYEDKKVMRTEEYEVIEKVLQLRLRNTRKAKWEAAIEKNNNELESAKEKRNAGIRLEELQNLQRTVEQDLEKLKQEKKPMRSEDYESVKGLLKSQLYKIREDKWEAATEKNNNELESAKEEGNAGVRFGELRKLQTTVEQDLEKLKQERKLMRSGDYESVKGLLKSQLHKIGRAKWEARLDQKFEENKNTRLNKIAKDIDSKYVEKAINNNYKDNRYRYFCYEEEKGNEQYEYRTFERVLFNRVDTTYKDKKILCKWDIYQVETFLEDFKTKKDLTEGDKKDIKSLKEIRQDLKNEMRQSKKDFNSRDDLYINKLKESRGESCSYPFRCMA
ncbi:hypothetical protein [Wolbachia endosymbiont of Ctenocephalides felis wCfeT]|uniref:hypothetical protein n=1 Tax=Wolbachia endosymbiont of Ctenocephalides felis wCfeT TaxID=2732593 RepID=UPI001445D496|nr:hypothetical protein [Wolbachia endosymbiont of Ctenocephalides felis wCfeT]